MRLPSLSNIILISFVISICAATISFAMDFPNQYSWGEELLNYQGGFTKRGMIGNIAFQLRSIINPKVSISLCILFAYLFSTVSLIKFFGISDHFSGLMFLFSPTGWLWSLLVKPAFGRKDIFIIAATISSFLLLNFKLTVHKTFVYSMLLFLCAGLIVETSLFYYPIVLLTVLMCKRYAAFRTKISYFMCGLIFTLGFLVVTAVLPTADSESIVKSWPSGYMKEGDDSVLCCLDFTLQDAFGMSQYVAKTFGFGYFLAFVFGSIPLLILFLENQNALRLHPIWITFVLITVFSFAPLAIAADWGRYIYLGLSINFICFHRYFEHNKPTSIIKIHQGNRNIIYLVLLLLYATTWQTVHFRDVSGSAFVPGILFRSLGESFLQDGFN